MTTAIIVIFFTFLAWLLIYRIFKTKLDAACDRIRSPRTRQMMKVFLRITFAFSVIVVVLIYVYRIVNMVKSNNNPS